MADEKKIEVSFYRDEGKKTLNPVLFSDTAGKYAEQFSKADERFNKRSQIRKFYDEVMRLNSLSKANAEEWDNILPYVNMLIAKATYAEGRKLVTSDFVDFMKTCIRQVHVQKDLEVFANFFEALMGFYRKYRQAS